MDVIKDYWFLIASLVSAVVWLVRLEAKSNQNGRDLTKLETRLGEQRKEDMQRIQNSLESVASDIKELLSRRD